ncbi:MAG: DUF92 domain-containing protein [Ignavibacteriales bacterium]|nr:DUF92 domain-containing protein [Ignavibacteriales bacterium]
MNLFLPPSQSEWILFVSIFVAIGFFIAIAEFLRHAFHGSPEITRKLVHILTVVLIFFAPELFISGIPALLLALSFLIVNFAAIQFGLLKGMHGTHRRSYGTVYYPLSFFILVLLFWDSAPFIISVSILILALSDAAAAIVGENLRHPREYRLTSDKKSYEGSAAMFVTTFSIVVAAILYYDLTEAYGGMIMIGLSVALFVTLWEAISSKGFDNLTVPLSAALMLHYFCIPLAQHNPDQMVAAIGLALIIAFISLQFKFLSPSGSAATFLLATIIFGIGGWVWTIPILTFFITSSLLSKSWKARKKKLDAIYDKTNKRDEGQVAANGGVAGIIILLWYIFPEQENLYLFYLASIAAVTADTWATEIGTLSKKKPISIVTFKFVEPGTSGGVSLVGFFGSFLGASMIVLSGWVLGAQSISLLVAIKIIISGMVGSVIDSVCGAVLQVQYQTEEGTITEKAMHDGKPTIRIRGVRWIDNDMVNWFCAASGSLAMYLLL